MEQVTYRLKREGVYCGVHTSAVREHKGWDSVVYHGRRYVLHASPNNWNARVPAWITVDDPILTREEARERDAKYAR